MQIDWKSYADYRKCMQENCRTCETMESWRQHSKRTSGNPHGDAAARAGEFWEPVVCCSNCSWRTQYDTNASLAKQEVCLRTHNSDLERHLFAPQNAIKNLSIWLGEVEQTHSLLAHHLLSVARRIQVVFRFFCCAAVFSSILFLLLTLTNLDGSSPTFGALNSTSL